MTLSVRPRLAILVIHSWLCLTGCDEPAGTALRVSVNADSAVATRLATVVLSMQTQDDGHLLAEHEFAIGREDGEYRLPLSHDFVAVDGVLEVRIVVRGSNMQGTVIVEQAVHTSFVSEKLVFLPVYLRAACLRVTCGMPGETCNTALFGLRCGPVPTVAALDIQVTEPMEDQIAETTVWATCNEGRGCPIDTVCSAGVCVPPCSGPAGCPLGTTCMGGGCFQTCRWEASYSPCPEGQVCLVAGIVGVCATPPSCSAARLGNGICDEVAASEVCGADTECPPNDCYPPNRLSVCDPESHCGCMAGSICKVVDVRVSGPLGACMQEGSLATGEACAGSQQCGVDLWCQLNACVQYCSRPEDCASGLCVGNGCQVCDPLQKSGCSEGSECKIYSIAINGEVVGRCTTNGSAGEGDTCTVFGDCAEGLWCSNGYCLRTCRLDGDCGAGRSCVMNGCYTKCDFATQVECSDDQVCACFDRVRGCLGGRSYCVRPTTCTVEARLDPVCDGPSGTRLCIDDAMDPACR